jgi:hypothetical protein
MGSTFYFIVAALTAALQVQGLVAASAEENAAPPQSQAQPQEQQHQEQQHQEQQHQEQQHQGQQQPPQANASRDADDRDSDPRRFVFHRIDGNLLRLDMRTGAVAMCSPTGADWSCVPGRDDRAALDRQVAQLQRDNAVLKNALLEHGVPLPTGMTPPLPSGAGEWWSGDETVPRPPQTVPPAAAPGSPQGGPGQNPPPAQGASPEQEVDRVMNAVERGWRRLVEMMRNLKRDLEK